MDNITEQKLPDDLANKLPIGDDDYLNSPFNLHEVFSSSPFARKWIQDHFEVDSIDEHRNDPHKHFVSRLTKSLDYLRDRGMITARYDCKHLTTGINFCVEIVLKSDQSYEQYHGQTLYIINGEYFRPGTTPSPLQKHWCFFHNYLTLICGSKYLNPENQFPWRTLIVISKEEEIETVKTQLKLFTEYKENPIKLEDLSHAARKRLVANGPDSHKLEQDMELLSNLRGHELNELLKNAKQYHIQRWLKVNEFMAKDFRCDKRYVVLNANETDFQTVQDVLKNNDCAFYVYEVEELEDLHSPGEVLVTFGLDYSRAAKHMKKLSGSDTAANGTLDGIQFLKFENDKLFRVISEQEFFSENYQRKVIYGASRDGKTRVLQHLVENYNESVVFVALDDFAKTKFCEAYIRKKAQHYKEGTVVVMEDSIHPTTSKVLRMFLGLLNVPVVLSTPSRERAELISDQFGSCLIAELLEMSETDTIKYILKGSSLKFKKSEAEEIFYNYKSSFMKMPALIWTALLQVSEDLWTKSHIDFENSCRMSLQRNISVAEIFDRFMYLSFESIVTKYCELLGTFSSFIRFNVQHALIKIAPELLNSAFLDLEESPSLSLYETHHLQIIACQDFLEYLVDLFSLCTLSGDAAKATSEFKNKFQNFFIKRYVQTVQPRNHLNTMLGYKDISLSFPFDIKTIDILKTLCESGEKSNICRVLFESFLSEQNRAKFRMFCESAHDLKVAKLLGFLHVQNEPKRTAAEILLIVSSHLGYYRVFEYLIGEQIQTVHMRNIQIRDEESFRSLLHLLMYMSKDNDKITVENKISIINRIVAADPNQVRARDYFGNTPILEQNVSFELVKHLRSKGAKIEDTNFTRRDIFDKNTANPVVTAQLAKEFPEIYRRHIFTSRAKSMPPVEKGIRNIPNVPEGIDIPKVELFLAEMENGNKGSLTTKQVAAYVCDNLASRTFHEDFQTLLVSKILSVHQMAFRYSELCAVINEYIADSNRYFKITAEEHRLMCGENSPFIVACLTGYVRIAALLVEHFREDWLQHLSEFELALFFQALDEYSPEDLLITITRKLTDSRFPIPCYTVQESLACGNLNLFCLFTEYTEFPMFPKTRWEEFRLHNGFGALHHVLENSIHDHKKVVERKKKLIDYILDKYPETLTLQDTKGRTALLLGKAHYKLITYIIEKREVDFASTDNEGKNILNVCLQNIIDYSDYLGESAYDISLYQHSQVIYLAGKIKVKVLANRQMNDILAKTRDLRTIKQKDAEEVGFDLNTDTTWICSKKEHEGMTPDEIKIIDSNYLQLKEMLTWSVSFSTKLIEFGALPAEDVRNLDEVSLSSERIHLLVEKLKATGNGYAHLMMALEKTGQNEAMKLLGELKPNRQKPGEEQREINNPSKRSEQDTKEPGSQSKEELSGGNVKRQWEEFGDEELKPDYVNEYQDNFFRKELFIKMTHNDPFKRDLRREDPYNLSQKRKGLAFVVSISEFDEKHHRHGGDMDRVYMIDILKNLGYDIFPTCMEPDKTSWTKQEFIDGIDAMKTICDTKDNQPSSIIVFISSHGLHDYLAVTDSKRNQKSTFVNIYKDILFKFYKKTDNAKSGCGDLDSVPKIFIFNACQDSLDLKDDDFKSDKITPSKVAMDNAIIVHSQVTGDKSNRDSDYGSFFVHCLAYVLMKYAAEKSLQEMLKIVREISKHIMQQIPEIHDVGLKTLYFNLCDS